MIGEIIKKLEELAILEAETDRVEREYDGNPESMAAEQAFDVAYRKEHAAFMEVSKRISELSGGKISARSARAMVRTKREDLEKILKD